MRPSVLACCIAMLSLSAIAQPGPSLDLGVHANITIADLPGPAMPNGSRPFNEVYGTGFGGGLHLDVDFLVFALRMSGDYITFAPDNGKYQSALAGLTGQAASQFSVDGGRINVFSVNVNGKMDMLPLPVVSPYLMGGIGLARISAGETKIVFNGSQTQAYPSFSSETKTAINLGAGVDLSVGITLFVEAKYTWILTEGETSTYVPVTVGVTF